MKVSISIFGKVDGGELHYSSKAMNHLCSIFDGKEVEIIVKRKKKSRSSNQNRYYWLILGMIASETGFTTDETHEVFKHKFLLKQKVNEKTGEVFMYSGSTSLLSTVEFMDYISDIQKFAAESLGMYLPDPNEMIITNE